MPITLRVAVKPTSSIRKEVETVDLHTHEPVTLKIRGRHDPCIAIRALPVVQTMVSYCLLDIIMSSGNPVLISRIFNGNSKDAS
jgi:chorismate synthase